LFSICTRSRELNRRPPEQNLALIRETQNGILRSEIHPKDSDGFV
jgi:hypothetical protein